MKFKHSDVTTHYKNYYGKVKENWLKAYLKWRLTGKKTEKFAVDFYVERLKFADRIEDESFRQKYLEMITEWVYGRVDELKLTSLFKQLSDAATKSIGDIADAGKKGLDFFEELLKYLRKYLFPILVVILIAIIAYAVIMIVSKGSA